MQGDAWGSASCTTKQQVGKNKKKRVENNKIKTELINQNYYKHLQNKW